MIIVPKEITLKLFQCPRHLQTLLCQEAILISDKPFFGIQIVTKLIFTDD